MGYPINEQLLSFNRPRQPLRPVGFVIHSTATPGATAQKEYNYFNSGYRGASAHYFVDWVEILRCIPENEIAWHAGPSANLRFLSVEMCEPVNDANLFNEVWKRTVWLVADACVRYGWNTVDNVFSHRGISLMYHETDHTDPIEYLAKYGKTWNQLLEAIDVEIKNLKQGVKRVKNLVVYKYPADERAAKYLADYLQCPVAQIDEQTTPELLSAVENVFLVGGKQEFFPQAKLISGHDRFDTMRAVLDYIGK